MAHGVVFMLFSTSGWLMKTKMVAWKPICHEIFCFNLHSGQTLIFCCKSLTVKFDVKYLFTTWFLETITFVFMMSQSSSDKKHINMGYQITSGTSNQRAKFVGFTLQTYDFAPLTRLRCKLRKGVYYINVQEWLHQKPITAIQDISSAWIQPYFL